MKRKRGQHASADKALRPAIKWLDSLAYVDRVIFGQVENCRHAYPPGTLRYQMDAPGGIKIKAYGGNGVMDVYVKVAPEYKAILLQRISERF